MTGVRYARPGYDEEVSLEPEKLAWFRTIDDLFALIETAQASAASVRADYDEALGLPRHIFVDYDVDLVGDELELRVTGFEPAPIAPFGRAPRPRASLGLRSGQSLRGRVARSNCPVTGLTAYRHELTVYCPAILWCLEEAGPLTFTHYGPARLAPDFTPLIGLLSSMNGVRVV